MANTIKDVLLSASPKQAVKYITISSDGSEETDLVVYDSSAVAATLGLSDPLDCSIEKIYAVVSAASTARVFLEWDATTDVLAFNIPANVEVNQDFRCFGISSLPNQGASANRTGDITLTTTGLESGDSITLILWVRRN